MLVHGGTHISIEKVSEENLEIYLPRMDIEHWNFCTALVIVLQCQIARQFQLLASEL